MNTNDLSNFSVFDSGFILSTTNATTPQATIKFVVSRDNVYNYANLYLKNGETSQQWLVTKSWLEGGTVVPGGFPNVSGSLTLEKVLGPVENVYNLYFSGDLVVANRSRSTVTNVCIATLVGDLLDTPPEN